MGQDKGNNGVDLEQRCHVVRTNPNFRCPCEPLDCGNTIFLKEHLDDGCNHRFTLRFLLENVGGYIDICFEEFWKSRCFWN